jgi:hypothetical protein
MNLNQTRSLTIEEVEIADKVLRTMIAQEREERDMFPDKKNSFLEAELQAMYKVQSRLVGILEDKRMSRGVITD